MPLFSLPSRFGRKRRGDSGGDQKAPKRLKLFRRRSSSSIAAVATSSNESNDANQQNRTQLSPKKSSRTEQTRRPLPKFAAPVAAPVNDRLPPIESTYLFGCSSFTPRARHEPFLSILEHDFNDDCIGNVSGNSIKSIMLRDIGTVLSSSDNDSRSILLIQFLELRLAMDVYIPSHMLAATPPIHRDWETLKKDTSNVYTKLIRTLELFHSRHWRETNDIPTSPRRKLQRTQTLFQVYFGRTMPEDAPVLIRPIPRIALPNTIPMDHHHPRLKRPIPCVALPPPIERRTRKDMGSNTTILFSEGAPWIPVGSSSSMEDDETM